MFKFDFVDALDDELDSLNINDEMEVRNIPPKPPQSKMHTLSELLEKTNLPPTIAYSFINGLAKRELFDVRFQLMNQDHPQEFVDAPSDLIQGVYEGGLKTWECSIDLVSYLESLKDNPKSVLELGCGSALPSLHLLKRHLSNSGKRGQALEIHLQDFNEQVLELVTLPNLILTWYFCEHKQDDGVEEQELELTPELIGSFQTALTKHSVSILFTSGPWSSFLNTTTTTPDLILTSETIYNPLAYPTLIPILKSPHTKAYVAAKVLYFGVGGGITQFSAAVEKEGGKVEEVWTRDKGVGRKILRITWQT